MRTRTYARGMWRTAREHGGSFTEWCRRDRSVANAGESHRKQVLVIAQALDALIRELTPDVALALHGVEVLARRFVAILMVEEGYTWREADNVELRAPDDMIPRTLARAALKESALRRKAEPQSRARASGGVGGGGARAGGGGSRSPTGAAASGGSRRRGKGRGKKGGGSATSRGGSSTKGTDGASKKGAAGAEGR